MYLYSTVYDVLVLVLVAWPVHRNPIFCLIVFTSFPTSQTPYQGLLHPTLTSPLPPDPPNPPCPTFQLNGLEIAPTKPLKVNVSVPNTRLFVGNIPKSKSRQDINAEFEKLSGNETNKKFTEKTNYPISFDRILDFFALVRS